MNARIHFTAEFLWIKALLIVKNNTILTMANYCQKEVPQNDLAQFQKTSFEITVLVSFKLQNYCFFDNTTNLKFRLAV